MPTAATSTPRSAASKRRSKDPNYVPPTGDNANLTLWVVLAAVCAVILVAVVVLLNKKRTRH